MDDKYPGDDFSDNSFENYDGVPAEIPEESAADDELLTPDDNYRPGEVPYDLEGIEQDDDVVREILGGMEETPWPQRFADVFVDVPEARQVQRDDVLPTVQAITNRFADFKENPDDPRSTITIKATQLEGDYITELGGGNALSVMRVPPGEQAGMVQDYYYDPSAKALRADSGGYTQMSPEDKQAYLSSGRNVSDRLLGKEEFAFLNQQALHEGRPKLTTFEEFTGIVEDDLHNLDYISTSQNAQAGMAIRDFVHDQFRPKTHQTYVEELGGIFTATERPLDELGITLIQRMSTADNGFVNAQVRCIISPKLEGKNCPNIQVQRSEFIDGAGWPARSEGDIAGTRIKTIHFFGPTGRFLPLLAPPTARCTVSEHVHMHAHGDIESPVVSEFAVGMRAVNALRRVVRSVEIASEDS